MNLLQAATILMIDIKFFEFIEVDEQCVLSLVLDSINNNPVGRMFPHWLIVE
jgi:hypothetical protein